MRKHVKMKKGMKRKKLTLVDYLQGRISICQCPNHKPMRNNMIMNHDLKKWYCVECKFGGPLIDTTKGQNAIRELPWCGSGSEHYCNECCSEMGCDSHQDGDDDTL